MLDTTSKENESQVPNETIENSQHSNTSEQEVVVEIDNNLAEDSEKFVEIKEETFPNYDEMDLENLVSKFKFLLENKPVQSINNHINAIKNSFDNQFSKILAEKKNQFLEEGGESINFSYSNPLKNQFNTLYKSFKDQRNKYYKNLETELKDNLDLRLAVIEQLKDLIENAEPETMYNKFRDIQARWKKIGPVAREKYNDTWRTFHHHVERFYDLLHMSKDFRDLDFKHNLEEKLKLVEKAEKLSENEDVNYAFKQLQILHKMWKENIGPVAREYREEVWQKFSAATKKIHDKRHDNFKKLKGKYEENIGKKLEVISKIENINISENKTHNDWQQSIKLLESLREQFFKIGNVSRSESEKIWNKFKEATRNFNKEKNAFYKKVKNSQQENLNKKKELIDQAEKLKDSEDWEMATEVMKRIQAEWKNIGHVPRKYSDKIWNQFKSACNHYFDRYHQFQNSGSPEEQEAYEKKKVFIEDLKKSSNKEVTLEFIKSITKDWRSIGRVPHSSRRIENDFAKHIDSLFSKLSIEGEEKEKIKFENQMMSYLGDKNLRKLDNEQLSLRKKIDEMVRDIQQLENNMSFFADKDKNNPLLKNVVNKLESHKKSLTNLKSKLSFLNQLDY